MGHRRRRSAGREGMGPTVVGAALGWAAGGRVGCFDKAGSPAPSDLGWKELESWALFFYGSGGGPQRRMLVTASGVGGRIWDAGSSQTDHGLFTSGHRLLPIAE